MTSKRCCRCKTERSAEEFSRDRSQADGLDRRCKPCKRELERAYAKANPDKARERQRRHYATRPDLVAARHRRWREKNPDWSAENNRKWRENNPGAGAAYHQANRDKARARNLRRAARRREATVGVVDLDALWVLNGGTCQLCGDPIDRSLSAPDPMSRSVDHIVPLSKGGTHEQSNVQWTHLVCNKKKGARVPVRSSAPNQGVTS